ncbi:N6-adenosine-methyltransferase non-catalytic subunit MTB-like [Phragmites australis]|uniref:N6-adenosine-methyltransferase non-catalytic subunit MTB-like n=1 Tax=Phragmites australis TaxID=29695 RepID=UPI002D77E011|nr:N6-adenosine-methyltransferase non-catalytic subunit MTB-like [Phragmites australis]XP_062209882.1 N6-adenosine-methyltransferase non-catalytic subunit MTB-like [Phragmites australis]XP_062209883.1 N6-adenosine-methyltransferase non-catalytic subunit MTB-like [Phragmites australis]
MEGSESSRDHSKQEVDGNVDARSSWKEEQENADSRDYAGRSRKHAYEYEVGHRNDDGMIIPSSERNEPRRNSARTSGLIGSADDDVYHVGRDPRSPKVPRRSPDDSKDRDYDRRRGREDKNDWDSSRRYSPDASAYPVSHSTSRSKAEGPHDGESERLEMGARSSERRENSREKQGQRDQEEKTSLRRADEIYADESGGSLRVDTREAHRDDKSDRGRDRNWNERTRELEGSKDYGRNNQLRDTKEANDAEWRNAQERLDGGGFHGRAGYRRDSRGRSESVRGPSTYGNRYDSSDSIEIRPNSNLNFGRESSVSGRRFEVGAHWEVPGGNDNKGVDHPEADQSGSTSMNSPYPQQGPKGDRPSRGGRGRPNGRDSQRIGVPMPIMPPPFGPLGLPPGPMQHMGPNIPHSPGPPLLPGVFMPPFPGPLVWPGARGVDMNMLSVPPNLPIPPPVAADHRFTPSLGAGSGHNIHLNQIDAGIDAPSDVPGLGFNHMGTQSRDMLHDKPSAGWTPHRNSGPNRKAPSRGEQNDYSQNFVDTGMRPQNFIRELDLTSVAEDYPKLRELIQRKDEIVANSASPPMYYKCDLREHVLSPEFFGTKFDVILVDPPWEEYAHRAPGITDHIEYWNSEEIMNLKIEAIADTPSFVFLWVGDGVGLEQGRQCLKKWGFRRCEDVCWVKTNKKNATPSLRHDSHTLLQHSKEHCLMGIKGTVRRSTDGHVIHANIDTDIIIAEEPTDGSTKKPEDMYRIIEHFALGRRRLELFGEDHNIRPGWLTLGKGLSCSNFNKEAYIKNFADKDGKVWQGGGGRNPPPEAPHLVVTTPEIESLRPKSPPAKN